MRPDDLRTRAREWYRSRHAVICDLVTPWQHGTVARSTEYPSYYDFNVVRVEDDPDMTVDELVEVSDRELAGLGHRRLDFDDSAVAEPLRPGFEALGWKSLRLVYMRYEGAAEQGGDVEVREVPYDSVKHLREAWFAEESPGQNPADYHRQAAEVAARLGVNVFAVDDGDARVAFTQLERRGASAEIAEVFVSPELRGSGLGTSMTKAAIDAAGAVDDLWIVADDEDRPKELYERLGFRPILTTLEFTRWPD